MAKSIMVQGTMSNVGKSLLTAGLCRIFKQDGYKTAPFKSQNMALNSFITRNGLELGRAQAMQAEAAGVEPAVQMNPILLKPTSDTGSQVIVNGKVRGTMGAKEYFAYKKKLVPDVLAAYQTLEEVYDIIVIEGAGSPAEINLKQDDIVNMGMAKLAKAPVLLAGDIDRGGVFAQLAGTTLLLTEEERKLVKGTIINKFRGDKGILEPGVGMIEGIMGIPVVGVVPYMQVDIEEEDSLTERFSSDKEKGPVHIAVVRLPRISNFTDFAVLESMDQVTLTYASKASQLEGQDLIILPGTKNTMGDLKWLRQSGMEAAILRAAEHGSVVFGICGGYQMLGELLSDPGQVEEGGNLRGMGLLPVETVFTQEKTRTRVAGNFGEVAGALADLSGMPLEGYEIHMGRTCSRQGAVRELVSFQVQSGAEALEGGSHADGAQYGNVYGTYVHGIFDGEGVAPALVGILASRKGISLDGMGSISRHEYKERQYGLLADTLRSHLDMDRVYGILERGI